MGFRELEPVSSMDKSHADEESKKAWWARSRLAVKI